MISEQGEDPPGDNLEDADINPGTNSPTAFKTSIDKLEKRTLTVMKGDNQLTGQERPENSDEILEVEVLMVLKPVH